MKLREVVIGKLSSSPGEHFRARELAEWIIENYPDDCRAKAEKSGFATEAMLRNQLVAEIGANRPAWLKRHPELKTSAERPRRYYWSTTTDELAVLDAESKLQPSDTSAQDTKAPAEHALYEPVIRLLQAEFGAFGMRIDEKTASNKKGTNGNKWLFPDICAMESLIEGLDGDVVSLVDLTGAQKSFIYSVEVKVILNSSNVREAFFQAVSNSSWANFGYLIAAQIDGKVIPELRMLHGLHGIGVIQLNVEEILESQVLMPARMNEQVDWETFNRLTVENSDFRVFAMRVKHFHQTNNIGASGWKTKT